jgi:hypothetical protein
MKNVTIQKIRETAKKLSSKSSTWHFHILTPECQLNDSDQYAMILEDTTSKETLVCYSQQPYLKVGKELVKLLHGKQVVDNKYSNQGVLSKKLAVNNTIDKILKKAVSLNSKKMGWHHHILFPGCIFNKDEGKYVIIFEDKETKKMMKSVTDYVPIEDLKKVETLFYTQKKID